MKWARAFGLAVGALGAVLGLGCGGDGGAGDCSGAHCSGAGGMGGAGGASGASGQGGTSGLAGSGGMGGAGDGGTGGTMEPPIVGPAPTACVPSGVPRGDLESVLTILYTGSEPLEGLALRRTDLFVSDGQGIMRLAEGATSLTRVAIANVDELLAADLRLYWVDAGSLYRIDFDANGGMPELVASGLQSPATLLRHDEENVFYAHASSASVWRQPLDGSAAVQLAAGAAASDLAVAGGSVYFASGRAVKRIVVETGAASDVLTDAPRPVTDIDTDGADMVWTDGVEVFGVELERAAMKKPLTQAGPSATGAGQSRITQIVLRGSAVYFLDDAGNVGMALLNGSLCELIADAVGGAREIAVDDEFLYLNKRDATGSQLWRIAL